MYKYSYKLKYKSEVYICKHSVSGFEDQGVKFGKASSDMGVIKSYVSDFQFLHEDAFYLKNITINYGFNETVKIEIFKNDFLKGDLLEYSGIIDLSTIKGNDSKLTFSVKEGGFITFLDNIYRTEKTISSGYKDMLYQGNQYNFDAYLKAQTNFEADITEGVRKTILSINVKQNNDNLEDIRNFNIGQTREIESTEKISNSDCFYISNSQEYLKNIKFNLNIDQFTVYRYSPFIPVKAEIEYIFEIKAYSNLKDEWLLSDSSLIFSNGFRIYSKYSLFSTLRGYQSGLAYYDIIGTLISGNNNFIYNSEIGQSLTSLTKNCKIVMTCYINRLWMYDSLGNRSLFGAGEQPFSFNPNIDLKMKFENYKLAPYHYRYVYKLSDVYTNLIAQRSSEKYNIQMDLSAIENSNLYLTSAGMLCGGIELKTSLEQLLQFIYLATGLRHIVDLHDNVYHVYFEKYENSFKEVEIAKIENASEIVLETEPDKIYTDVEVGWANKETGIFKSLEYNTINKFRTQYNNIETNTLSLNCTYSASVTDIETIIYNSGYNDKSNDVNNIFVIECYNDNGILRNKQYTGVAPMTLCGNVALTPKRLLEVHKYELSDFLYHLNVLKFNTTNGKADITLDGITENTDVAFNNQIMQPFILSFEGVINQSIIKIDGRKYGYFTFMYNGNFIRGYIAEGSDSVSVAANGNTSKLRLLVKKETNL